MKEVNRIIFLLLALVFLFAETSVFADMELIGYQDVFNDKLGINPKDITNATYFYSDTECVDLPDKEIDKLRNTEGIWYDYVVAPPTEYDVFPSSGWLKMYADDKVVFMNLGSIFLGEFGNCEAQKNYVWYKTAIANSSNAIVNVFFHWGNPDFKKNIAIRAVTDKDLNGFPNINVLSFSDADEWAKTDLQTAAAKNLIPPYMTEQMREPITRDEFCSLAYRTIATCFDPASDSRIGISDVWGNLTSINNTDYYNDVDYENTSYVLQIAALSEIGIIKGDGNGAFRPKDRITREEAAVMLERMMKYLNKFTATEHHEYFDNSDISEWALKSVFTVYGAKIMYGNNNNEFNPKGCYTKQESILTMLRLYNLDSN